MLFEPGSDVPEVFLIRLKSPELTEPEISGPAKAELFATMLLLRLSVAKLAMPPPLPTLLALFPDTVQFVIVSVPELLMPPPSPEALFPDTVQLIIVSMPKLRMPPPKPLEALPFLTVTLLIVRLAPLFTTKTLVALFPEISILCVPPAFVIVNLPDVEAELMTSCPKAEFSVIVQTPPEQPESLVGMLKLIMSFADVEFAAAIASRRLQSTPELQVPFVSAVFVTV
jgi:hypothetical protein